MSTHIDDWHKLVTYDTNLQGQLHANLLENNGIKVSLQTLSSIPGMNSGAVLWVHKDNYEKAQQILNNIDVNNSNDDNSDFN